MILGRIIAGFCAANQPVAMAAILTMAINLVLGWRYLPEDDRTTP